MKIFQNGVEQYPTILGTINTSIGSTNTILSAMQTLETDVVDTNNSTSANLLGGGVFTGVTTDTIGYGSITISVISSHVSVAGGCQIQFSADASNWDWISPYYVAAASAKSMTVVPQARYFRVVYTNGATGTTYLRITSILRRSAGVDSVIVSENCVGKRGVLLHGISTANLATSLTISGFYNADGIATTYGLMGTLSCLAAFNGTLIDRVRCSSSGGILLTCNSDRSGNQTPAGDTAARALYTRNVPATIYNAFWSNGATITADWTQYTCGAAVTCSTTLATYITDISVDTITDPSAELSATAGSIYADLQIFVAGSLAFMTGIGFANNTKFQISTPILVPANSTLQPKIRLGGATALNVYVNMRGFQI